MDWRKEVEVQLIPEFKELFNPKWRNIIYRGGRGGGKSYNFALSLLLIARSSKKRVLCTREIQKTIKDSVHKLLKDRIEQYGFTDFIVTDDSIKNSVTGSEFIFKGLRTNTTEIKSLEGIDYCWVEEAHGVSKKSWGILTPTIRKPGSQIWISYNPDTDLDPVNVEFCKNPDEFTYIATVNYDVMDKYGLFSESLRLEMERDKRKKTKAEFANKWLGVPLNMSDMSIFSMDQILEAFDRQIDDEGAIEVGVDVARLGSDRTTMTKRKGSKVIATKSYQKKRTTEVCDLIEAFVDFNKKALIKIDDTGVGGGVTDEMIKRKYNVVAVNFGGKAKDSDKYPNTVSEMWFELLEQIDQVSLIEDQELLAELSSRWWEMDNKGRRKVESKDDYKKRTGNRSPDKADALILCFYRPSITTIPRPKASDFDTAGGYYDDFNSNDYW